MKKRQSELFEEENSQPNTNIDSPIAAPESENKKTNKLVILGVAFAIYAILGEFLLPEPIKFTTLISERKINFDDRVTRGTADAQALLACKQAKANLAQQKYVECLHDKNKTGPTCDFIRDDILGSNCE